MTASCRAAAKAPDRSVRRGLEHRRKPPIRAVAPSTESTPRSRLPRVRRNRAKLSRSRCNLRQRPHQELFQRFIGEGSQTMIGMIQRQATGHRIGHGDAKDASRPRCGHAVGRILERHRFMRSDAERRRAPLDRAPVRAYALRCPRNIWSCGSIVVVRAVASVRAHGSPKNSTPCQFSNPDRKRRVSNPALPATPVALPSSAITRARRSMRNASMSAVGSICS